MLKYTFNAFRSGVLVKVHVFIFSILMFLLIKLLLVGFNLAMYVFYFYNNNAFMKK